MSMNIKTDGCLLYSLSYVVVFVASQQFNPLWSTDILIILVVAVLLTFELAHVTDADAALKLFTHAKSLREGGGGKLQQKQIPFMLYFKKPTNCGLDRKHCLPPHLVIYETTRHDKTATPQLQQSAEKPGPM